MMTMLMMMLLIVMLLLELTGILDPVDDEE
jgi:hypothetical protein